MSDYDDLIGTAPDDKREKLEDLFYKHLPQHRKATSERYSVYKVAKALGMTRQGVNLWFQRKKIPVDKVNDLIDLPGSTFTLEILFPWTLRE